MCSSIPQRGTCLEVITYMSVEGFSFPAASVLAYALLCCPMANGALTDRGLKMGRSVTRAPMDIFDGSSSES